MVEIIGLVTIGTLVWLLAWSMAGESESERRKHAPMGEIHHIDRSEATALPIRHAA